MGVDLNFLVPGNPEMRWWLIEADIGLERRRELWEPIGALPSVPAPLIRHYRARDANGETAWGDLRETPYRDAIRFVQAGDLAKLANHKAVLDNAKNRAAFAYVAALPSDWPVALYWH